MRIIIQRVLNSSVMIDNEKEECINKGLMILLGITYNDSIQDINYLVNKILNLRIFEKDGKMDLSVCDINAEILLIPQFTLYANCKKGSKPSFSNALEKNKAEELFSLFCSTLKYKYPKVKFGKFSSYMQVSLVNDGPVTLIVDSK